ncbi:uncharacterized protein LOC124146176 [Haliotis rufescens]|uniref:uncharacterized protein LOC124146176 n=1 Tax=Haliotis rufescens TaxID=6454 RepID=UPI001EB017A0|nr:uncharacterized protein LOC124146176 [Haliotis rufescens]
MARVLLAGCVIAVCLAYCVSHVVKRDMGMGTADDGDSPSGGDEGGASGDVNCLDSGSCPGVGGVGCVALGDSVDLNACTQMTCTVVNNVYGLRADTIQCAYGGKCYEGGAPLTLGSCDYTCSISGVIGFTPNDPDC